VTWRERLRQAIEASGRKQSVIAAEAGVAPETLSRILNSKHAKPTFETIVRIAHATDERVGWLLGETGFALSIEDQKKLREAVDILQASLIKSQARSFVARAANALPVRTRERVEIPEAYYSMGARVVYRAEGDSMIEAGIADRDLLFVRPARSIRDGADRVVVCRFAGLEYAKQLDIRGRRIRLLSRNARYESLEVTDDAEFTLIGVVVGRTGALAGS